MTPTPNDLPIDQPAGGAPPICVDLDGTLFGGDLLFESFLSMLRSDPRVLLLSAGWLARGRAELKKQLATRCLIDFARLPYNDALLEFLRAEKAAGRTLVLATAADRSLAEKVAAHLGLFDRVLASDGTLNLKGAAKGELLSATYPAGFHYIGNGVEDLPVWAKAGLRSAANASSSTIARLRKLGAIEHQFAGRRTRGAYLRALRPHQWLKNLLIFVPLLAAHKVSDLAASTNALLAFASFSLTASAVYLLNDLWDLESDRQHRSKFSRPLAAGAISIPEAAALSGLLLVSSAAISFALPAGFRLTLLGYFATTCLYSFWLKRKLGLDAVVLTLLYSARLLAGGKATGIPLSFWLLCFSQFFFFSLAMLKRYSELFETCRENREDAPGRGYVANDLHQVAMLGSASGIVASFVVAMFVNSEQVRTLYRSPNLLLLVCPLLLYWLTRVWILAGRGKIHEDPIVFAVKDRTSIYCGLCLAIIIIAASTR
ncbi:MAG TPA: UbiA family prenyltransferase [Chthoniobacteraceae bacterium]|jgi:4-hydroxybenzoate polyprenyltransferase|nr:UbiA family prenyltransferase [Chthoniobacteraceae bacterium]